MAKERKIPERMCVACRNMFPKDQLVRLVLGADGSVTVDTTGKLNGRGVYLCKNRQCVEKARKNKGFAKAHGFTITDQIQSEMEKLLEQ